MKKVGLTKDQIDHLIGCVIFVQVYYELKNADLNRFGDPKVLKAAINDLRSAIET